MACSPWSYPHAALLEGTADDGRGGKASVCQGTPMHAVHNLNEVNSLDFSRAQDYVVKQLVERR
jgi:hypothetical protein